MKFKKQHALEVGINCCFYKIMWIVALLYNSVHFSLFIILLRDKAND